MLFSHQIIEKVRPDAVILLAFVITPLVVIGAIFGEFKLAIFVSLPGLISEAIGLGGYIKNSLLRHR